MHLVLAQIGAIAVAVLVAIGQYQSAQKAPDQNQDGQEDQSQEDQKGISN